jgi:hypothetical protein
MQLCEIIKKSKKIATISDIVNNIDFVTDLTKEDVLKLTKSKKIYFADFDFTYSDAVEMLKKQIKKSHLKAIKRFIQFENIEKALKWLISRILNNSINITTNRKYKLFCRPIFLELHENIEIESDHNRAIELLDLEKVDTNTIKIGLKNVWNEAKYDSDFDFEDFEELCCKFKFNAREVVGSDTLAQLKFSKSQVSNKHSQLELLF